MPAKRGGHPRLAVPGRVHPLRVRKASIVPRNKTEEIGFLAMSEFKLERRRDLLRSSNVVL